MEHSDQQLDEFIKTQVMMMIDVRVRLPCHQTELDSALNYG